MSTIKQIKPQTLIGYFACETKHYANEDMLELKIVKGGKKDFDTSFTQFIVTDHD